MDIFAIIAERKIQEAMDDGKFDNLAGQGKPLDLDDLLGVPSEFRMAYTILKNAGALPPEIELTKEISELETSLDESDSEEDKKIIRMKLNSKITDFNIMQEKNKRRRNPR